MSAPFAFIGNLGPHGNGESLDTLGMSIPWILQTGSSLGVTGGNSEIVFSLDDSPTKLAKRIVDAVLNDAQSLLDQANINETLLAKNVFLYRVETG